MRVGGPPRCRTVARRARVPPARRPEGARPTPRQRRMTRLRIRELGPRTWADWLRTAEKHNGVWGGCWCVTFHLQRGGLSKTAVPDGHGTVAQSRRELKERLVSANRSHAALVYAGDDIVGWCQYGSPVDLPGRLGSFLTLGLDLPRWRITCFFVDRDHRREGIASAALNGALRLIAANGGGSVDAYPIDTREGATSGSFLWSGTRSMFEKEGFRTLGALGKNKLVMRKVVRPRGDEEHRPARNAQGGPKPTRRKRGSVPSTPDRPSDRV